MNPATDTPSALSNPLLMEARRQVERDMDDSSVRTLQDKSIVNKDLFMEDLDHPLPLNED